MLKGTIVKESLINPDIIASFRVLETSYTRPDYPNDGWCLYKVDLEDQDIKTLSKNLKPKKWYAHFWDKNNIYVVYPNKIFMIDRFDKSNWKQAINYGLNIGIPLQQLDFLINE